MPPKEAIEDYPGKFMLDTEQPQRTQERETRSRMRRHKLGMWNESMAFELALVGWRGPKVGARHRKREPLTVPT
jgi:hypothetical protein